MQLTSEAWFLAEETLTSVFSSELIFHNLEENFILVTHKHFVYWTFYGLLLFLQHKYPLLDEKDINLVKKFRFEVSRYALILLR